MMKFIPSKFYILLITFLVIVLLGFYWYGYRPSKIRHDCSWVPVTDLAQPAEPEVTQQEAQASQSAYNECYNKVKDNSAIDNLFSEMDCNKLLKSAHPAIPAQPVKVWYRKANTIEYDFCIHEQGL